MTVRVSECSVEGIRALEVDNGLVRVLVLPDLGAKILSLVDLRSGREWMARSGRPLVRREYGDRYDAYDYSGWDECFPGIGECFYPEGPWRGIVVPDHGELWTLPWRTDVGDGFLRQSVHGVRFPYTFERQIDFNGGNHLTIAYALENHATFPFKTFWSAHPMLAVTPLTRFLIPEGLEMRVEVSKNQRLGDYLAVLPWPIARDREGREVDLSLMGNADRDQVDKLFSIRSTQGWGGIYDPVDEDFFVFTFRPQEVPFIGVCAIRGRWPTENDSTLIGLVEPCNGWPDRLDVAIDRGESIRVPAGARLTWELALDVGRGRARLQEILRGQGVDLQRVPGNEGVNRED